MGSVAGVVQGKTGVLVGSWVLRGETDPRPRRHPQNVTREGRRGLVPAEAEAGQKRVLTAPHKLAPKWPFVQPRGLCTRTRSVRGARHLLSVTRRPGKQVIASPSSTGLFRGCGPSVNSVCTVAAADCPYENGGTVHSTYCRDPREQGLPPQKHADPLTSV